MTAHESYCQLCGGACALATPPTPEQAGPSGEALTALLLKWKSAAREASLRNDMENAQWDCACASTLTDCARDLAAALASPGAMEGAQAAQPRPVSEWHDDDGSVLWWRFEEGATEPCEAPWAGMPTDPEWDFASPGYFTHWTPIPRVSIAAHPPTGEHPSSPRSSVEPYSRSRRHDE